MKRIKNERLKPFWEMIERAISKSGCILYLLLKYKKRCESYDSFFILEELKKFREAKSKEAKKENKSVNVRIEEDFFAPKINCYLFDNDIDIVSEPKVKGKRVDVLGIVKGPQAEGSDFLMEYKVFLKSNKNQKEYLKEAFYQAYSYGKNHQKSTVYLIIFIIGEGDITLNLDQIKIDGDTFIPYYEFEGIRILAIKINLKEGHIKGQIDKTDLDNFFRK